METTRTTRALRLLRPDETPKHGKRPADEPVPGTEDYWARVQALRDDLARLRPAN